MAERKVGHKILAIAARQPTYRTYLFKFGVWHGVEAAASIAPALRWGHLPLQLLLVWWLLSCTKPRYVLR